jgi:drug/metabolite transporter (DMT)-like permease
MKNSNMAKIFGLAFILALISAVNLAMFIGREKDVVMGAVWGFAAGFGWVATFVGTHYLFERKSFTLFLINAGYSVVALTIMGVIIVLFN